MKKYNIPVNWVQKGLVTIEGSDLKDAVKKAESLDLSTMNVVGQAAPDSTRVAYNGISQYTPDEKLFEGVTLYTSSKVPNCPFCDKATKYFEENNIEFKTVDIMVDRDQAEYMFFVTKSLAMPQVQVGNEILVGFIEEQVEAALVHYGVKQPKKIEGSAPTPEEAKAIADAKPKIVKMPQGDPADG